MQENKSALNRAKECIPHQTFTMSKRADQRTANAPAYTKGGIGNKLMGEDNRLYLDYMGGLGTNILGYKYIKTQKGYSGASYSLPTHKEIELTELLIETIPCAEMAIILKTGSEACQAAVRIARAHTKREYVVSMGYHGWHDIFNFKPPGNGTPRKTKDLIGEVPYNNMPALKAHLDTRAMACVIMEPVMLEEPNEGYLQKVRELCDETGTVLIFDEIVTGYWWDVGGYQKICGITPDIACFGKAMANGLPISAVVGKREIMGNDYFISSTYSGETSAIGYAISTINELLKADYKARNQKAEKLFKAINKITTLDGFSCRAAFPHKMESWVFWQEAVKQGLLFGKPYFFNFAVTDKDLDFTLDAISKIDMSAKLEGECPKVVFDDGRRNEDKYK